MFPVPGTSGFLIEGMNRISVDLSSNWFSRNLFSSCMMDLGSAKVYVNCRDSSIEALFVGERSSFKASHHDIQAKKVYIRFPLSISVVSFSVQEEAEQHYTKYTAKYVFMIMYVCMQTHCIALNTLEPLNWSKFPAGTPKAFIVLMPT